MGHSFGARLKADLTAGTDARLAPAFNLVGKVDNVLFLGTGGKCINDVSESTSIGYSLLAPTS